jgi:hypothetical protein
MNVCMTEILRQGLLEAGSNPDDFIKEFKDWKSRGPAGEDSHYYFGKDAEYARPIVNGRRVLRHVHFVPLTDLIALPKWDRAWERHSRRVSDTALVYADGGHHGFLLLTILYEPEAHIIAEMKTKEARELMMDLAKVAEQFQFNGTFEV